MRRNGAGKGNLKLEHVAAVSVSDTKQTRSLPKSNSTDKASAESSKQPSVDKEPAAEAPVGRKPLGSKSGSGDISAATFLDVAVLRCLFISHWQEEGVYWGLHYLYNRWVFYLNLKFFLYFFGISKYYLFCSFRLFECLFRLLFSLRDISEETVGQQQPRRRSNSLPIPKIQVSLFQTNEKKQEAKDFIEVPEVKDVSLLAGNDPQGTVSVSCFLRL